MQPPPWLITSEVAEQVWLSEAPLQQLKAAKHLPQLTVMLQLQSDTRSVGITSQIGRPCSASHMAICPAPASP